MTCKIVRNLIVNGVVTLYPATGYRTNTSGALAGMGTHGFAWHCAISGVGACYLAFDSLVVYPSHSHNRAHGFPVRCVQHLQLLKYSVL
jgi:hypothetical protein